MELATENSFESEWTSFTLMNDLFVVVSRLRVAMASVTRFQHVSASSTA